MKALTEDGIGAYLRSKALITKEEGIRISAIPSNVNRIFRVQSASQTLIVRQSLGQLVRFPHISLNPRRTQTEYNAIRRFRLLGGSGCVPVPLLHDKENSILVFRSAPEGARLLTADLLRGKVSMSTIRQVMRLLAAVHNRSYRKKALEREFSDRTAFEKLKVGLYSAAMRGAETRATVRSALDRLISETLSRRIALVHGDTNPKNILVFDATFMLIDYELAHYGDPAFDVSNLLAHYLLSALINFRERRAYFGAIRGGWEAYEKASAIQDVPLSAIIPHFGPVLWGRAFGEARVPFLSEGVRKSIAPISRKLVLERSGSLEKVFALVESCGALLAKSAPLEVEKALRGPLF